MDNIKITQKSVSSSFDVSFSKCMFFILEYNIATTHSSYHCLSRFKFYPVFISTLLITNKPEPANTTLI